MSDTRPKMLGPYQVVALLGKGGMARVYRCTDTRNGLTVAVKVFGAATDADARRRFEREIRVLSQMRHPYIAPLLDHSLQPGLTYMVMPYYPGGTVADQLREGPYSPVATSHLLQMVAHALDYAHSQGYIHCDLKPSNFMIDGGGNIILTDFGLAKAMGGGASGNLMGTLPYVAPELITGGGPDVRSDVYALGASLCEILTGLTPFDADDTISYLQLHRRALPPAPSQLNPALPPILDGPILAALQKSPKNRPQSAGELAHAFHTSLIGLPAEEQTTPAPRRARPHIVYKPVSTSSGVLTAISERETQARKPSYEGTTQIHLVRHGGQPTPPAQSAPVASQAPTPRQPSPIIRRARLTLFAIMVAVMLIVMLGLTIVILILRAGA